MIQSYKSWAGVKTKWTALHCANRCVMSARGDGCVVFFEIVPSGSGCSSGMWQRPVPVCWPLAVQACAVLNGSAVHNACSVAHERPPPLTCVPVVSRAVTGPYALGVVRRRFSQKQDVSHLGDDAQWWRELARPAVPVVSDKRAGCTLGQRARGVALAERAHAGHVGGGEPRRLHRQLHPHRSRSVHNIHTIHTLHTHASYRPPESDTNYCQLLMFTQMYNHNIV